MASAQAKTNILLMLDKVNFVQRFPPKKASARIYLTGSERQFTASICLVVCNCTQWITNDNLIVFSRVFFYRYVHLSCLMPEFLVIEW